MFLEHSFTECSMKGIKQKPVMNGTQKGFQKWKYEKDLKKSLILYNKTNKTLIYQFLVIDLAEINNYI